MANGIRAVIEVGLRFANIQNELNKFEKQLQNASKDAKISPEVDDAKVKDLMNLIQELRNDIDSISHEKVNTGTFNGWSSKTKTDIKELQDRVSDLETTVQSLLGAMSKSGDTPLLNVLKNMSDASDTLNKSLQSTASSLGQLNKVMNSSSGKNTFKIDTVDQLNKIKEAKQEINRIMSDYEEDINADLTDENGALGTDKAEKFIEKIKSGKTSLKEVKDFVDDIINQYDKLSTKVANFNPVKGNTESLEDDVQRLSELSISLQKIQLTLPEKMAGQLDITQYTDKIYDFEDVFQKALSDINKKIDATVADAKESLNKIGTTKPKATNIKSSKDTAGIEDNGRGTGRVQATVPAHIAEGAKGQLLKELSSIVELLTIDMKRHPVEIPVEFTTGYAQRDNKRLIKELTRYVKGSYDQMSDAERKGLDNVISKLEKRFNTDIPINFRTNIKDVEKSVQRGLKAIDDTLKANKDQMKIYPSVELSDEAKATLQEQLNKISKSFQIILDDVELTSDFGNKVEEKIADAGKDGAKQAADAVEEVLDHPAEGYQWDTEAQGFVKIKEAAQDAGDAIKKATQIQPEINHIHFDIDDETLKSLTTTFKTLQTMADRISRSLLGTDKVDAYTQSLLNGLTEVAQRIDTYFGSGNQLIDLSSSADKMKADFVDAIDAIETKVVEFTNKFPELFSMATGATNTTDNTKITETTEKASESLKDVSENADKASSSVDELSKNQNLDNFLTAIKQVGSAFDELENSAKNVSSSLFNIEEINNWKKAFIDAITDIAIKYQDVFGGASSLNKLMDTFKGWYQGDADRLNFYQNNDTKNWESTGTKGKKKLIEIPTNERALIVDKNGDITHEFGYYLHGGAQTANNLDPSGVKGAIATIHSHSERLIPSLSALNRYSSNGVYYTSGDLRSALVNYAPNGIKYQAATGVNGLQVLDIQKFIDALKELGNKLNIKYDSKNLDSLYQEIFGNIPEKTTNRYANEAVKGIISKFGNTTIEEAIGNLFNSVSQGNLSNDLRDKFVKAFKNVLDNSGNLAGLGSSIDKAINTALKNVTDKTSKQGLTNIQSYWSKQGASGNLLGIIGDLFKNAGISIPKGYDTQSNIGAMLYDYLNTSAIKDVFRTNGINPDTFLQTYTYDQFKKKNPMGLSQGQFQSLFSNIKIDTTPFDELNKVLDEITGKITSLQSAMGSIGDSNFSVMVKESDELSGSLQQITETLVKIANTLEEIKIVSNGITTNNDISGSVKETDISLNSIEENIKSIVNVLTEAKGALDSLNESLKSTDASTEGVVSAFKELYGKKMTDDKMNNLVDNLLSYKKLGGQKNNLGEILSDAGLNVSDKTLNKYESQIRKILNVREELSSKNVTTAPLPFTNISDINQNNIEATTKQLKELRTAISGIQNGLKRINELGVNDTFLNDKNIATIKELTDALQGLTALKINETDAQSMDAIQESLKKISNISVEDVNSLADALKKLLDALNGDVKSNGFVNALNQLAGADLKGLLKVLNTNPSTIEKAAKAVGDSNYNAGDILKQYGEKSIDDAIKDYFKDIAEVFSVSTRTLKDGMLQAIAYVQDIDDTGKAVGASRKATFKVNENGSVTQLGSESSAKIEDIVRELKSLTQAEQEATNGAEQLGNAMESEAIIPGSDAWAEAMANFNKLGDKAKEIGDILSIKRQARLDKNDEYAISDLFVGTKGTFDTGTDSPILFSEQTIANTKEMQKNVKEIEKTAKEYYDLVGKQESGIITQSEVNQLGIASDKLNKLISQVKQYDDLLGSHTTIGQDLTDALNNAGNSFTGKLENDLRVRMKKIDDLAASKKETTAPYLQGFKDDIAEMHQEITNVSEIIKSHETGTQYSVDEINRIFSSIGNFNKKYSGYTDKENIQVKSVQLDKLLSKINGDLGKHSGAPKDLLEQMEGLKKQVEKARENISTFSDKQFKNELAPKYENLSAKLEPYDESFTSRIGKSLKSTNAQFFAQFFSFYDIIRYGREAFETVKKLDNEMVELAKVSNASDATLSGVFSDAADMAQELGVSIDNVLTSITDWNRLGYNIADSETLAKTTELFEVVGDSMTQQSSQEGLTSIMKGWNMTADQSMSILDKLNEVANNYSIATNDEVEAITRGGAQLSSAGNDLSQSLGMIVAANDAVRDPSSVGTMLKTFSMRLRGANSSDLADLGIDTTGMASGTKSVVQIFKHMAGIDIMEGTDYKSTYDILDELAAKWDKLTDAEKAALSEAVGGKRGGSIMASLMTNWQDAKDVVETANNSQGSAEKEQKNREKSIQVAFNRAKSQVEEVIADMADKGFIKNLIDGFTAVLKVVEKITSVFKSWSILPLTGIFLLFQRLATGGVRGLVKDFSDIGKVLGTRARDEEGNILKTAEGETVWKSGILSKIHSDRKPADTDAEKENSTATDENTVKRNENAAAADNQTRATQEHADALKNENLTQEAQNTNETIDNLNDTIDEMDDAWGELNQHPELGNMDNAITKVEQEAQNATTTAVEGATEVVAQTGKVTNALSETTKEATGVKAAFSGLGASIKNNLGGIALGVGAIIATIVAIKGVASSIVASENEAFDQAQKNIENAEQNMKNAQKTINEIQQGGYNALRKGVNTNTNQNLSLTDEDYQTYLEYNNKIAELVPEIVAGYDAQGNAVIKYTDKIKDLNDALEEYNKKQIEQKDGFDDALLTAIKNYRKFQTGDQGTIGSMFGNAVTHKGVSSKDQIDYINELLGMSDAKRKNTVYNDNNFGGERNHYNGKRGVSRRDVQKTLRKDQNASLDDLLDTKNLLKYKDRINTTLDSIIDTAKKTIQAQAKATDGYYDLDETQQAFISTLVNGSDELITKILNNPKSSSSEKDIQIKDLANDAFSTTTKLSKIKFVGSNGKKTTLLDSLVNFDDNTKKTSIRNLQGFYDDIDDELHKHFSDDDVTYLERTLGFKDKQGRDISRQYKDKILNVVNGIKRGITGQQRTDMIDSLLGMSRSDLDSFLTSATQLKNGVNTYQDALVALKYARIKNAAQADTNVLAYDNEATNISNVQQAVANSQGASGLTKTDLDNIKSLYQGLKQYNPDKLFENTTEGIHLNQKALAELNDEYVKTRKSEISDALNEQYTALIKCQDAMKNASDEDKEALETQQKQIKENIDLIAEQASMYDGLTSKYAEWQRAQQTPNEGANNEAIGNYWKTAKDLAKDFKFGTDDMRSFVGLISGKDLSTAKVAEVRKEWERISNLKVPGGFKLTDLYTDDYQGSARFLQAVHATNPNWASQDKNGSWKFDFEPQDLADKWGVNVEVIENMIKQLGDYIDVTLDDTAKDAKSKMESLIHKYDIIGKDGKTFTITIDTSQAGNQSIMEINENIEQVEQNIKDINDGTIDPKANASNLKKLRDDFKTLVKYKAQAESQIHFHIDTSKLTKQGQTGFQTLTQYYQLKYEYRESKKTGDKKLRASIAKDVKAKRKEVDEMVKADPTIADELNIPLTAQGTVNWKGFKDEKGNTVKGLDQLINNGEYISKLSNKFSNEQAITVTVKTNKGQINATNKDLKKVSKYIDEVRGKSNTTISVGLNTISFDLTNNALSNFYNKIRDIRNNSHINVTVNQKTVKTEEDHTSGKKDKKNKKSSSSERTSSGRTNSDNISGMTKSEGQNNKSYAGGKKVEQSPKTKGKSLVGELGTELLVRNGHYQTIGDNGAEMIDVYPSDIIFNHEQTKELLKNGSINSRGFSFAKGKKWWGSDHKKLDNYGKHKVVHQPKQKAEFIGNVDINKRPIVQNGKDTYSTTITAWQGAWRGSEENGHYIIGHFVTILEDGTILSNDETERYMSEVLNAKNPWSYDKKHWKLLYKIDNVPKGVQSEKQLYNEKSKWYKKADKYDIDLHNYQDKKQRKYAEQAGFIGKAHTDGYNNNDDIPYDLLNEEIDDNKEDISDSFATGKRNHLHGRSYARGKSLVGELGAELLVRNGHYQTIGNNGAEMIDVQPNDIIFNHEQTKQLLENGKINSRGKSYADGTLNDNFGFDDDLDDLFALALENGDSYSHGKHNAFAGGTDDNEDLDNLFDELYAEDDDNDSYAFGKSFSSGGGYLPAPKPAKKSKKKKTTAKRRSNSNKKRSTRSSRKSSSESSDWSDASVEEPTNFDWIEVRLSRINDNMTQLDYNVNRTYLRWGVRHKALNGEIAKTEKLILNAGKGATKYLNKAKSIEKNVRKSFKKIKQESTDSKGKKQKRRKYSDKDLGKMTRQFKEYAKKVREGKLQIQDIKNPDMVKAIQDYQTWYEKYRSARDQVQQAIDKRHELRMQKYEQANTIRSDRQTLQQTKRSGINSREEFLETHGVQTVDDVQAWYDTGVDTYKKELKQEKKKNADLKKQREETIDDALGVISEQDEKEKAYNKAKKDKAKILPKLKKVFGTSDLEKIQKAYETTAKKKKSGKKLTKSDKTKLKAYNKYYKEVLKDQSTIDTINDTRNALKYVNLDKTEKKKYTNAQADKKLRETRLKKAFGTINQTKIQSQYDNLIIKQNNNEELTDQEKKQIQSYKDNFQKLSDDKAVIQEVRDAIAETSDDVIKLDNDIAESDNNLAELQYESINRYFDMLDKKMTAIETKYTNLNVQAEGALSRIDSIIQLSQSKGYLLSGKFYDEQIKYQKQEGENIKGQLQESLELLKQYPADTKEYYDAYNKVVDLGNQEMQNESKVAQLEKEKADLEWTKIERKHTYIGYLNEELGWLESILETDHKITDAQTGRFNEYGVSALATYAKQYNTYMVEADEWAKDVQKVKAELDNDPDNTELQDKYQQYMQNWRNTITSGETAKKSMSNLMKQQYDAELAALKTVLDYRKKELEAQKSIYQYQKDITEKSRSVESIEKQLMAFQNDTSEEGKARTEKLKDQLRTAKQSLQDTEYNQYVSDQEELLDNLYTEFQNMFEDKMDDLEQVVKDAIKIVNDNQSTEVRTIDNVAKDVGYKVTDGTKNILNSQSHYYTNIVPGEFETLNTTISSEVKDITDAIASSEAASEKILDENIDKLITQMPKPITLEELENIISGNTKSSDDSGSSSSESEPDTNNSDISDTPVTPSVKGDYKEYFSKTGKYTNADDDINVSRHKRVTDAVDHSDTKHSNKKAKKGTLEYFLYHTYGAGNTNTDLINYWNAIHGDHKKKVKDKLSSAEKKDLMAWFKAFYSDGGTIGKAIKMSGEDGMILAKTGEEVLSIEKVKELQKALALLQPIHGELNQIHNIPTRTLNDNSVGDVSIVFNMPNVSNYEDFAKKLKSDTNMQKYIQQITIGEALGQNSLLKKKF